jgi:uncharacterized protein YfaP (DUF2135 family)
MYIRNHRMDMVATIPDVQSQLIVLGIEQNNFHETIVMPIRRAGEIESIRIAL